LSAPGRPSNFSRMIVERARQADAEAPVTRHNLTKPDFSPTASPAIQSRSAERMRRARNRKRQGAAMVNFLIGADAVRSLIELGWLVPERRGDRDAVRSAVIQLAARALALRIRPGG
jgi:hypothetical protein